MGGEPSSSGSVSDGYRISQRIMKEGHAEKYKTVRCANSTNIPLLIQFLLQQRDGKASSNFVV